jgi:hypothetical protein
LLEVMVAALVLTVAVVSSLGSMVTSYALNRTNRETAVAEDAARRILEEVRSVPFNEAFAIYNADASDNGGLSVAARGPNFAVGGLEAVANDPDGLCARVMFPSQVVVGVEQLREDVVDPELGMPQDLNGDGAVDAASHANAYVLLPVRVRIEWRGAAGRRSLDLNSIVCLR